MSRTQPIAVMEVSALGAALVILDRVTKAAPIRLLQAELNDYYGFVLKLVGDSAALESAIDEAEHAARRLNAPYRGCLLHSPSPDASPAIVSEREYQPLIDQEVVFIPTESDMPATPPAIGLIETQGFTAVIQAIDAATKAADVTVLGKEKLGGGYITVLLAGDTAAVESAVAVAAKRVDGLGKLIAAHVITAPSDAVMGLVTRQ